MSISLQDQLKKSGLIDEKKAKQLTRAKHKQEKIARKSRDPAVDQHKLEREQVKQEKVAKDRALNQQKNAKAERNAIAAQIRQLIENHRINGAGEQKYSFADGNIIKHLWVSHAQVEQLSRGFIAVVKQGDQYLLVPMAIADKIAQRDVSSVIYKAEQTAVNEADDPYADYPIPDDLIW
jgi:uncharacterized protein YaiL (DUF2058 family)